MTIFDMEQEILDVWRVLDDVELALKYFVDNPKFEHMPTDITDELMNKFMGIKELYDLKFDKLWNTFEKHCKEYHTLKRDQEIKATSRSYVLEVREDAEGQYIEIPQAEIASLGWEEGDTLEWGDNGDGSWTISKKSE